MKLVVGKLIFRRNMYKNNKNPKKRQRVDFVEKSGAGGMEVYLGSFAKGEFISDTKYYFHLSSCHSFSDTAKYKTPVVISARRPQENLLKKEVWRNLGVNVEAMGSSQPDLEWIYSTIQGPPVPPSGNGGNKFLV